jgi:hypothetical protein
MYSNSDFTAVADYGYLHFSGSGSAESVAGNGVFLWVDDWIGAEPRAQHRDRLFVTSTTLPAGTPAVVEFRGSRWAPRRRSWTRVRDSSIKSALHRDPRGPGSLALAHGARRDLGNPRHLRGRHHRRARPVAGLPVRLRHDAGRTQDRVIAADVTAEVGTTALTAGVSLTSSSTAVDVPVIASPGGFAPDGAWPNPVRNTPVTVHFALPSAEPAVLPLFDVHGRRVA